MQPMSFTLSYIITLFITFFISLLTTPFVKLLAFKIGAVDKPNKRRINKKTMPSAGGLSIYIAFFISTFFLIRTSIQVQGYANYIVPILGAGFVIIITGLIDDIKEISPWIKTIGIFLAGLIVCVFTNIRLDTFKIPGQTMIIHFPIWLSIPLTLIWIYAITNVVNLIDGLDGLASGVTMISMFSVGVIGYFFLPLQSVFVPVTVFSLIAAILGFFPYNYHPATIYLGDTGALFLGFMMSVMSVQGLKNATFVAVLTPMFVLGVPIVDTFFAILRRKLNKQSITSPDKMHLHHRLMALGFSHRATVLTIYGISTAFSFIALLLNYTGKIGMILLVIAIVLEIELLIELAGVLGENRQPLLNGLKFIGNRNYRQKVLKREKRKKEIKKVLKDNDVIK